MELSFNIWSDALATLDTASIPFLVATALLLYLGYAGSNHSMKRRKSSKYYPPFAPGGVIQHVTMVTSTQYPWWLLVRDHYLLLARLII